MASQHQTGAESSGRPRAPAGRGGAGSGDRAPNHSEPGTTTPEPGQYLTFRVASEIYALSVLETSEVLEYHAPTPVPGAPSWVSGMLNLRGRPVPVIDLAAKFGIPDRRPESSACIVVLDLAIEGEASPLGVLVDDMPAVVHLVAEQIAEPPRFGTLVHVRYLRGMARLESGLVLLLDAAGALTSEEAALLWSLELPADDRQHGWTDPGRGEDVRSRDPER